MSDTDTAGIAFRDRCASSLVRQRTPPPARPPARCSRQGLPLSRRKELGCHPGKRANSSQACRNPNANAEPQSTSLIARSRFNLQNNLWRFTSRNVALLPPVSPLHLRFAQRRNKEAYVVAVHSWCRLLLPRSTDPFRSHQRLRPAPPVPPVPPDWRKHALRFLGDSTKQLITVQPVSLT